MLKTKENNLKIPGLDGFRFIAFVFVLLCHTLPKGNSTDSETLKIFLDSFQLNGIIGMKFFFFLSAFLLTFLSLKRGLSNFNTTNFFRKRALRILPLYLFILVIGFIILPLFAHFLQQEVHIPSIIDFLTLTQNFYFDLDAYHVSIVFFLLLTWSIAVEVQFYILLGLALNFLKKYVLLVGIAFALIGLAYNAYNQWMNEGHYFHTLTYFTDFGAGIIFAYFWNKREEVLENRKMKFSYPILFFGFIILALCWNTLFQNSSILFLNNLLFPIVFCFLLFHQMNTAITYFKPAQYKWVEKLGEISYGLYLYHGLVITLFMSLAKKTDIMQLSGYGMYFFPLIVLFLSILLARVSYAWLELPFLRRK